mgnify:FL=1
MVKRFMGIGVLLLIMAGCGEQPAEETANEETTKDETTVEDFQTEENETTDPMIAGSKAEETNIMASGVKRHEIQAWYTSEETNENGFTTITFDDYTVTFSLALVEDEEGNEAIGMFGETENDTGETIAFNNDTELVTDQKDQTEFNTGLTMETKDGVKEKGFAWAELEYGKPETFTLYMEPPLVEVAEHEYEDYTEEAIEMEFHIEE